jgi:hypothetical protein
MASPRGTRASPGPSSSLLSLVAVARRVPAGPSSLLTGRGAGVVKWAREPADTEPMRPSGGPGRVTLGARTAAAAVALLAVVCWASFSATGFAVTEPATSGAGTVSPILECVWHVGSTKWLALWGYSNSSSSTQTVPVGTSNSFSPGATNQGQPTSFGPGTHDNVFTVPFVASKPPAWTLDGTTVSSSPSDKKCANQPVPIIAGTTNWTTALLVVFLALGILGVGIVCWRVDPDLLALRRSTGRHTTRS